MSTTISQSFVKIGCKTKKLTLATLTWISTFNVAEAQIFLYSWVLQSKKVWSKSNVKQKSLRFSDVESILQYDHKIKRLKLHIPVLYEIGSQFWRNSWVLHSKKVTENDVMLIRMSFYITTPDHDAILEKITKAPPVSVKIPTFDSNSTRLSRSLGCAM